MKSPKYHYSFLIYVLVCLAIFFSPCILFAIIALSNHNLQLFFDLPNKYKAFNTGGNLNNIINFNVLPHKREFYALIITSLVFFGFSTTLFCLGFFKNKINNKVSLKHRILVISTTVFLMMMLISSFLLMGVAEYQYSWFNNWVKSLKGTANIKVIIQNSNLNPKITALFDQIWNNHHNDYIWIPTLYVSAFTGLQIMFAIIVPIRTRIKIYDLRYNDFNKLAAKSRKRKNLININYWKLKFASLWEANFRNSSLWLLVGTILIMIPLIIYLFVIYIPSDSTYKFLEYFYLFPNLFKNNDIFNNPLLTNNYYEQSQNFSGNFFLITQLPVLMLFISLAIIGFYFWSVLQQKYSWSVNDISYKYFRAFIIITVILDFLTISCFTYSQIAILHAISYWNTHVDQLVTNTIFKRTNVPFLWLRNGELYASIIIMFVFTSFFNTVGLISVYRIKNQTLVDKVIMSNAIDVN